MSLTGSSDHSKTDLTDNLHKNHQNCRPNIGIEMKHRTEPPWTVIGVFTTDTDMISGRVYIVQLDLDTRETLVIG